MKKMLLSMAVVALCAGTVLAQSETTQNNGTQQATTTVSRREANRAKIRKMPPEEIARMQTERLNKIVGGLTAVQKKKANAVYLEEAQQLKGRMAERKQSQERINAILTKEQIQKFQAAKEIRAERMRARAEVRSGK